MSGFPIIDLAQFAAADPAGRARIGTQVDRICRETGFLAIAGHGVPAASINAIWAAARGFFDQPASAKQRVAPPPGAPYGYLGPGAEALAKSRGEDTPPDLKESFNGGPLAVPPGETDADALAFCYAPTPWPDLAGFRAAWQGYYREMEALAARIMQLFAVALGLEPDHFAPLIDAPVSALRALNYPATDRPPAPGQQRAGAHTDYGSLTILLPEPGSRGLEVQMADGHWQAVPPMPGAFVINIGDLMQRWTNDRWQSTLHRVVVPPEAAGRRRMSLAFFHQPNWHAEIACLDPCRGDGARHGPVLSGPYLQDKFTAATAGQAVARMP